MPTTKLTLTVRPEVIRMAKQYARKHNTSVSATFSRVIRVLVDSERNQGVGVPAGSSLEKLSGIVTLPEGKTADDIRYEALVEKFGLAREPGEAN
jgi:hypothetical protein